MSFLKKSILLSLGLMPVLSGHCAVDSIDFSYCGYAAGNASVPFVEAVVAVDPVDGDATDLIQQAIEKVSSLPPDESGFRGAVLLKKGAFRVSGKLVISESGVVLRGSDGTVLVAAGTSRRNLIEIRGRADVERKKEYLIAKSAAPGDRQVVLDSTSGLKAGDKIFITRPCTKEWIHALGMDQFVASLAKIYLYWTKGSRPIEWDRTVEKIEGNTVYLNAPLTTELDPAFGESTLAQYCWPGRIRQVGIENLRCVSEYDASNRKDEEHSWVCVNVSNARDVWVRDLTAVHFAGSAVMLQSSVSCASIENCRYLEPVSEDGGLRRVSFYNAGQLNLFHNCYAENGRHDFAAGVCSAGPNVFKDCMAVNAADFSGSIGSWACGTLFDNVTVSGNAIRIANLRQEMQGAGWSASHCVLWNCQAAVREADNPPSSENYIYGGEGPVAGSGVLTSPLQMQKPFSLFENQFEKRTGAEIASLDIQYPEESPKSFNPLVTPQKTEPASEKKVEIVNGHFVFEGKTVWGGHLGTHFWVANLLPHSPGGSLPNLTRFAPGRSGAGLTDSLDEIIETMRETDCSLFFYRPGLWYDRRRCDHTIVKRMDANVWGPFYEMPWARSGQGEAWDGLSKYDLTKYNPWYFSRLKEFGELCDQNGVLLYNQLYNNHNVVESAAHWADCPWRPANALQDIGIPEPPPYELDEVGSFRIHVADRFYDISNPVTADLHRRYIRHCLDNLKDVNNVVYDVAFQYAGSLEFMKFFLDTARDWQTENRKTLKLSLHTGKNITDAILNDPEYSDMISVIHTGYWTYLKQTGELFAPPAGENKAFRELRREYLMEHPGTPGAMTKNRLLPTTSDLVYKQVREYTTAWPDKVIIAWESGAGPLPVLMAGGGYVTWQDDWIKNSPADKAGFNQFVKTVLADFLWKMKPSDRVAADPENNWCLANEGEQYLIYSLSGKPIKASISSGSYQCQWFSPSGKTLSGKEKTEAGKTMELNPPNGKPALVLLQKI